jgi:hypothetical protein
VDIGQGACVQHNRRPESVAESIAQSPDAPQVRTVDSSSRFDFKDNDRSAPREDVRRAQPSGDGQPAQLVHHPPLQDATSSAFTQFLFRDRRCLASAFSGEELHPADVGTTSPTVAPDVADQHGYPGILDWDEWRERGWLTVTTAHVAVPGG